MEQLTFKLDGRIWIKTGDEKVLGHGRVELLERIRDSGSIRQAALQMKMSYKQAWDMVNHLNTHFAAPLVISQRGGKGGGKAVLTDEGARVINYFHQLQQQFQEFLAINERDLPL